MKRDYFENLKKLVLKEKKIIHEIGILKKSRDIEDKKIILTQIQDLKKSLEIVNKKILNELKEIKLTKPFNQQNEVKENLVEEKVIENPVKILEPVFKPKEVVKQNFDTTTLEKETIKRLKKKEKKVILEKEKKASKYVNIANKIFSNISKSLLKEKMFKTMERDLVRTNLQMITHSYISVILLTTFLAFIGSLFISLFFLFFNLGATLPFITRAGEPILQRFVKVIWMIFVFPLMTFFLAYFYPSMEKMSSERGINQELPFATINMSAISGSMVEPSKIFNIIISTNEYPYLQKELTKLINEINVHGKDLVTALKRIAFNSPSAKLTELLNGLATTINSGGNLPEFFDKRSQSLLFDHRLEKEKNTKAAETFMDIYISVVIAAPMILMLLLIMMKISGLGISVSTSVITLIMVLGVSIINIVFLTFLYLKQPKE